MPHVRTDDGVECYYEADGSGPTVAFVPTAGYGAWQWAWQAPALAGPFETIVPDLRGTGRSDTPDGPYSVDGFVADLDAVLADVGATRVHLVGAGLGGVVALEYARQHGRARSLAMLASPDGKTALPERLDDALGVSPGDETALRSSLESALSAAFREQQPGAVDGIVDWRRDDDASLAGWQAQADALTNYEREWPLYECSIPALVIHGGDDAVVPPAHGRRLADGLPKGSAKMLDGAGHLVGVERSRDVNDLLVGFLEDNAALEFE